MSAALAPERVAVALLRETAIDEAVVRYAAGESILTLSKAYQCSYEALRLRLVRQGVTIRSTPRQGEAGHHHPLADFAPLGRVLIRWRQEQNLSRKRMAHEIGMDPSWLTRAELGERHLTRPFVVAVADYMELSGAARDELYAAAGLLPPSLEPLADRWPAWLTAAATAAGQEAP